MTWHKQLLQIFVAIMLTMAVATPSLAANKVGEVTLTQGAVTAQQKGEEPRFIAKGDALLEGDVLVTSNRGYAVIGLLDGTRMTLRPSTTLAIDELMENADKTNAKFSLVRGGIRGITGSISKQPDAMKIRTKDATLAVREPTSFDARLCESDCAQEADTKQGELAENRSGSPIVGKVAKIEGTVTATGTDGQARILSRGAAVFSEDKIQAAVNAYAVLAFRDQSKMTVTPNSIVALENVRFEGENSAEGSFTARLIKGGLRAFTGLLGKRKPESVHFNAVTATIGIRGTGIDMALGEHCFTPQDCSDAVFTYVWDGAVAMDADGKSLLIELARTGAYVPARHLLFLLDTTPDAINEQNKSPRPDQLDINFENLFGLKAIELFAPGLYVTVRDGHIEFIGNAQSIDLGAGESGYLKFGEDVPIRLSSTPKFLLNDLFPTPDNAGAVLNILEMFNPGASIGDAICEIK